MRNADGGEACGVAAKLRTAAALLGCAGQMGLCAAFRRVDPQTDFELDRSRKWMQGRTLPRSPRVYGDWAAVLRLDRSGAWVAACTLGGFVGEVSARHGVQRAALFRRAGLAGDATAAAAPRRASPDACARGDGRPWRAGLRLRPRPARHPHRPAAAAYGGGGDRGAGRRHEPAGAPWRSGGVKGGSV